jgi:Lon protease-like protein
MGELGLFPLPLVLLPTERLPLHIFEERYKELIGECLETDAEFGFVYAEDDALAEVGTRARVTEVLTRFGDGRLNILVEGGERFRLLELTSGRTFRTGRVEELADGSDGADPSVVDDALRLFDELREVTRSDVETPERHTTHLSFSLAGKVELPAADKLELLSERSERARMERVRDLLEGALRAARQVRRAAERAAGNGRVDLG